MLHIEKFTVDHKNDNAKHQYYRIMQNDYCVSSLHRRTHVTPVKLKTSNSL